MQQEVHYVVPGSVFTISEDGVVEQVAKRSKRPIKYALVRRPPVVMSQDLLEVGPVEAPQTRVEPDDRIAVEQ